MILKNICRRVLSYVVIYICPSNIFRTILCLNDFAKSVRLLLAAVSMFGCCVSASSMPKHRWIFILFILGVS